MRSVGRFLLVAIVALLPVLLQVRPSSPAGATRTQEASQSAALQIVVDPNHINVGRDVILRVTVSASDGGQVTAQVSIAVGSTPVTGTTVQGAVSLTVHATVVGHATVQATTAGYATATLQIPIVPGPPASVEAVVHGISILAPGTTPQSGVVGSNLFQNYHAVTSSSQLASLGIRDGTLIDLNTNTDVLVKDPLLSTLNAGELFLQVVHGTVSQQVQAGSVVAATKGTRFDIHYFRRRHTVVVTVLEGRVLVTNHTLFVLVPAGYQTTVVGNRRPSKPKKVDVGAVVAWVRALPNTTASTVPPTQTPIPAPLTQTVAATVQPAPTQGEIVPSQTVTATVVAPVVPTPSLLPTQTVVPTPVSPNRRPTPIPPRNTPTPIRPNA